MFSGLSVPDSYCAIFVLWTPLNSASCVLVSVLDSRISLRLMHSPPFNIILPCTCGSVLQLNQDTAMRIKNDPLTSAILPSGSYAIFSKHTLHHAVQASALAFDLRNDLAGFFVRISIFNQHLIKVHVCTPSLRKKYDVPTINRQV